MNADQRASREIRPRPAGCQVPLTTTQRRYLKEFVDDRMFSDMSLWQASATIQGPLNPSVLRTCIEAIVHRHQSLRTRIVAVDGIPQQHIDAPGRVDLESIDLAAISHPNAKKEARRIADAKIREHTNLSVGPLFSAKLLRVSPLEHVLLLVLDHVISDGASCAILSKEIWTLYDEAVHGAPLELPPLPIQFADYAVWQQLPLNDWQQRNHAYWKQRLAGASALQLPFDRCDGTTPVLAVVRLTLGPSLTAQLRQTARNERSLLALVVFSICVAVLAEWSSQRDLVIGFMTHGRQSRPELGRVIGYIAHYLPVRIEVAAMDSFLDLIRRVNLEISAAYQHDDFDRASDQIPAYRPHVQFNWLPTVSTSRSERRTSGRECELSTQPFELQLPPKRVIDLSAPRFALAFRDTADTIDMAVWYRSDQFSAATVEQFCLSVRCAAEQFVGNPRSSVLSARGIHHAEA